LVTLTTVGYGDMFPLTAPGKVVGALTMICGIMVLAFPLTILSNNFGSVNGATIIKNEQKTRKRFMRAFARGAAVRSVSAPMFSASI